jgi:hypothetical protein
MSEEKKHVTIKSKNWSKIADGAKPIEDFMNVTFFRVPVPVPRF